MNKSTCPLCSGELTRKEQSTVLCDCGFKICHWCLSRIAQDKLCCPSCHSRYSSKVLLLVDILSDSQPSSEQSSKSMDWEKKNSQSTDISHPTKSNKLSQSEIQYYQSVRIIQCNLVYVIGLAPSLADESLLRRADLFGQYGTIKKIILNNSPQLIEKQHSCCVYITYEKNEEAYNCIMAVDGVLLQGCQLRASFGTSKYCNYFLRGIRCTNTECMYLHYMASEENAFTKKEMQSKQKEFYIQTHPAHSDCMEVPVGENRKTLPPPQKEKVAMPPQLTVRPEGRIKCGGEIVDYSVALCNCINRDTPFSFITILNKREEDEEEVMSTLAEVWNNNATSVQSCTSVHPLSSTSIDMNFLLSAEEYIQTISQKTDSSNTSWQNNRCNSIDSNIPVE